MPTKRHLALAVLLATALVPGRAEAGEYTVVQCGERNRAFANARFDRTDGAYYGLGRHCESAERANSLTIDNLKAAPPGAEGRISWSAPDGARVVGASAAARLRSDAGHRARLSFLDPSGRQAGRIATGADEPGGFARYSKRLDGGRAGFAALLICIGESGCGASSQARTWLRNVRLTLDDRVAPTVTTSGSLLAPGWIRGERELAVAVADRGAGVRDLEVRFAGTPIAPSRTFACDLVPGTALARVLRPCPAAHARTARFDTTAAPFEDGVGGLTVCARDLGSPANRTCRGRLVAIDNTPPHGAFLRRDPDDPELVRARLDDAHSGVAAATIAFQPVEGGAWTEAETELVAGGAEARIDSRRYEPGRYRLRLAATDVAGNSATTGARADGGRMELEFPLQERTSLRARLPGLGHRVRYGVRPRLEARLHSRGVGLRGREVKIVERFEPGSRPQTRRRTARSGRGGRITARLSRGPSRKVEVRFGGDRRYLPVTSAPRKLAVSGRARLGLSARRVRAGGRLRFRGRVGSLGARIPAPGKVVELQAREAGGGRFRTVRSALHSDARGGVRTAYSFGRFYRRPTRYQFRLKVTRQARWPYRAPTHSRPRPVTVVPR
jgi:hypothetical protein